MVGPFLALTGSNLIHNIRYSIPISLGVHAVGGSKVDSSLVRRCTLATGLYYGPAHWRRGFHGVGDLQLFPDLALTKDIRLRAFQDAYFHDLRRFQLPLLGALAERWLMED